MNKYKYKYEYITKENIKKLGILYYTTTDQYLKRNFYIVFEGEKKKLKSIEHVNEFIKTMLIVELRKNKIDELL